MPTEMQHRRYPEPPRGEFIVFEGVDGAGTTTQLDLLAQWLRASERTVEVTREPSNGPLGAALRQAIEGRVELDPATLALAFAADRADHINNSYNGIEKNLRQGSWVLCDRYVLSSLAYQRTENISVEWLLEVNRFAGAPDLTIFLDTPANECFRRISARSNNTELFHRHDHLVRLQQNYLEMLSSQIPKLGRVVALDGRGSIEEVFARVVAYVQDWMTERGLTAAKDVGNVAERT